MDRRSFLGLTAAVSLAMPLKGQAAANGMQAYQPGLVDKKLAAGETVFLDFTASWCGTCRSQGRSIEALLEENPAYGQSVAFIAVDWDAYKGDDLTKRLQIPRRSTLVALKGNQELGRLVADTRKDNIKALMDKALAAATA